MLSWGFRIPLWWAWRGIWNSDLATWTKEEFTVILSVDCLHFSPFTLLPRLSNLLLNWQLLSVMSNGFGVLSHIYWSGLLPMSHVNYLCLVNLPRNGRRYDKSTSTGCIVGQILSSCQYLRTDVMQLRLKVFRQQVWWRKKKQRDAWAPSVGGPGCYLVPVGWGLV